MERRYQLLAEAGVLGRSAGGRMKLSKADSQAVPWLVALALVLIWVHLPRADRWPPTPLRGSAKVCHSHGSTVNQQTIEPMEC
jgi:hypothetical protein